MKSEEIQNEINSCIGKKIKLVRYNLVKNELEIHFFDRKLINFEDVLLAYDTGIANDIITEIEVYRNLGVSFLSEVRMLGSNEDGLFQISILSEGKAAIELVCRKVSMKNYPEPS